MPREKKGIVANGDYKANATLDTKAFVKTIARAYEDTARESKFTQKKSFSPSGVGYGSGTCPRYWFHAFEGAWFDNSNDAPSLANMDNGTRSHDRIQSALLSAGIAKELEREIRLEDPPIHGYVDLIAEWDDEEYVGEIKTTRMEVFAWRQQTMKPAGYHLIQLLLYMHVCKIPRGFVLYENKNDHSVLVIPVEMNARHEKIAEETLEWMRTVKKNQEEGTLPKRPFEQKSKECKSCPVREACWSGEEGVVDLPVLQVPK
jgi:CRISPR/Cas system-associated exonuclease Cas4 (RecB family)